MSPGSVLQRPTLKVADVARTVAPSASVRTTRAGSFFPTGTTKRAPPFLPAFARATGHQPKRSLILNCSTTLAPGDGGVTSALTTARRARVVALAVTLRSSTSSETGSLASGPDVARNIALVSGVTVALNVPSSSTVVLPTWLNPPPLSASMATALPGGSAERPENTNGLPGAVVVSRGTSSSSR